MEPYLIINDLESNELEKRRSAAEKCAKDPQLAQTAVVPLCRAVSDSDERVAQWCTAALEELGPPAKEERDALVHLFGASESTAYWAVTLVGRLGRSAQDATSSLVKTISNETTPVEVRNRAIWALGKIEATGDEVTAVLQKAAESSNPRTARLAAKALQGS